MPCSVITRTPTHTFPQIFPTSRGYLGVKIKYMLCMFLNSRMFWMKPTRQLIEAKWTVLKANQVMPCCLFGTIYDLRENTAVKFETKSIDFHWRTNASENIFYVLLTRVLRSQFANKDGETISQESLCIILNSQLSIFCGHLPKVQWNLSVTTTSILKFITCDLFSYVNKPEGTNLLLLIIPAFWSSSRWLLAT